MLLEALLIALPAMGQASAVNDSDGAKVTPLQQDRFLDASAVLARRDEETKKRLGATLVVQPWNEVR
jgi:hypothetical protein